MSLRWRLYLLWIKFIDKSKMIAKMIWALIQVYFPLMFYINEIPTRHNSTKKGFMIFFSVTLRPFIKYHSHPLFSVTQHHEKHWDPPNPYACRSYWAVPMWSLYYHHTLAAEKLRSIDSNKTLLEGSTIKSLMWDDWD